MILSSPACLSRGGSSQTQEQGVSRIVSVKFHKTEETAAVGTTDQQSKLLVPPPKGGTVNAQEDATHTRAETLELSEAK